MILLSWGVERPWHSMKYLSQVVFLDNIMNCASNCPPDSCLTEFVTFDTSVVYCYTFQEVAESVKEDFGSIDILVHSLANGPEVQ